MQTCFFFFVLSFGIFHLRHFGGRKSERLKTQILDLLQNKPNHPYNDGWLMGKYMKIYQINQMVTKQKHKK